MEKVAKSDLKEPKLIIVENVKRWGVHIMIFIIHKIEEQCDSNNYQHIMYVKETLYHL